MTSEQRLGYQQAIDDLLAYDAMQHLGHVAEGDDACELCAVARHTAANFMATLTRLGLAPDPAEVREFQRRRRP